ncbi:MAG TPA: type II toxin-antitoxin system VapC family toxin [Vicinamibacterales bacterium]|nr:type II toxin-antitoxin system VapC family toxin [Vicinamibacterales bacterium]
MWAYFDTSALVKRYVNERGRREVLRLLRRHEVVTSALVTVELRSAFRRRLAEGTLHEQQLAEILKRIDADREFWALIDVSTSVLAAAERLVGSQPLRTLDAIHVASARLFADRIAQPTLVFVTADVRQTAAALGAGMTASQVEL